MLLLDKLLKLPESESLDFKQSYPDNNVTLLHDILCLANSQSNHSKYLVFGVDDNCEIIGVKNDTHRKTNADLQNLLKDSHFSRIPRMEILSEENNEGKTIDILEIDHSDSKPYFLTRDKTYGKKVIRAGVIYTRNGDTNTPLKESASDLQIQYMWQQRFGLDLKPIDRFRKLIMQYFFNWECADPEENILHYSQFPEFTLNQTIDWDREFNEEWCHKGFISPVTRRVRVDLQYHQTVLSSEDLVSCDNYRFILPLPTKKQNGFYVYTQSLAAQIAFIYQIHTGIGSKDEFYEGLEYMKRGGVILLDDE